MLPVSSPNFETNQQRLLLQCKLRIASGSRLSDGVFKLNQRLQSIGCLEKDECSLMLGRSKIRRMGIPALGLPYFLVAKIPEKSAFFNVSCRTDFRFWAYWSYRI